jgi:hypothetical protein
VSELKVGTAVFVPGAKKRPDGTLEAARVMGRPGYRPAAVTAEAGGLRAMGSSRSRLPSTAA